MLFNNVVIESFAHHLPSQVVTSEGIEARLDSVYQRLRLPHGRLELMTGIKERRLWPLGTLPSKLSTEAAKLALEKSSLHKEDIGILVHSSVCRDFLEPATASVVHHHLGLDEKCTVFDLSNACLGVLNSMLIICQMIEQKSIKAGMIVSGENATPLLEETIQHLLNDNTLTRKNIKKYVANLTIGSAAVCYILTHKDHAPQGHQILGGASLTDSSATNLCQGDGNTNSLMMETNSEELMHKGIKLAKKTWEHTKNILSWENDTPNWVVGHQVGVAHEKLLLETLGLNAINTHQTYPFLGNTGSAALPVTLSVLSDTEKVQKGQLLALLGIGSGLGSIMLGVKW